MIRHDSTLSNLVLVANYSCWNFTQETSERLVRRDFCSHTVRYCSLWHRLSND